MVGLLDDFLLQHGLIYLSFLYGSFLDTFISLSCVPTKLYLLKRKSGGPELMRGPELANPCSGPGRKLSEHKIINTISCLNS